MTDAAMDDVLLRSMGHDRRSVRVTVGQLITVKEIFGLPPRGAHSAIDPELTIDRQQRVSQREWRRLVA